MALQLPTCLYRPYDAADVLLYVGITNDVAGRMQQHEKVQPWWPSVERIAVQVFADRPAALAAELQAIHDEKPLVNVIGVIPTSTGNKPTRPRLVAAPQDTRTALLADAERRGVRLIMPDTIDKRLKNNVAAMLMRAQRGETIRCTAE